MARFTRDGDLVRIFATTTQGAERAIVTVRRDADRARNGFKDGPHLYDFGQGETYIPSYTEGCAPTKVQTYVESVDDIRRVFEAAGLVAPKARPARFVRSILARLHRNRPQGNTPAMQTIR